MAKTAIVQVRHVAKTAVQEVMCVEEEVGWGGRINQKGRWPASQGGRHELELAGLGRWPASRGGRHELELAGLGLGLPSVEIVLAIAGVEIELAGCSG